MIECRDKMRVKKYYKYQLRHRLVEGVREKKCTKCKMWKDQRLFSKNRINDDGLTYWCKMCEAEYSREHYRKNRKSLKEYYTYEQRHRLADGVKQKRCSKCKKWIGWAGGSRNLDFKLHQVVQV